MNTLPPGVEPQELPPPDTHCWDDDTQKDVWSYSKGLVLEILAKQAAQQAARVPLTDERYVSVSTLARMVEDTKTDPNQPGHHRAKGWNAALRQAMDYAHRIGTEQPQAAKRGEQGEG